MRLWPDGGFAAEPPATRPVEIPVADLPGILRSARDALRGFLGLVERWAARHVPAQAAELTSRLHTDLAADTPLPGELAGPSGGGATVGRPVGAHRRYPWAKTSVR